MFTDRELDFLFSLRTSWPRLYSAELARLLKEDTAYPNQLAEFFKQTLTVIASEAKQSRGHETRVGFLRRESSSQ